MKVKQENKAPYLLGILCLIPLVGFFVGIALILYGIFKYKDKLLIAIGIGGVLVTIGVYAFFFYNIKNGKNAGRAFATIAQTQLNNLINQVELYKIKEGTYPDSIQQLVKLDSMINIYDPLLTRKMNTELKTTFEYKKEKEHYTLFSVGMDGIPGSKDDIYPIVSESDTMQYGWVKIF